MGPLTPAGSATVKVHFNFIVITLQELTFEPDCRLIVLRRKKNQQFKF